MKANIHPQDYRLVVFEDLNNNTSFLVKSTVKTKETVKYKDGQTYPLVKLHITSASHPFYTGVEKMIDIEGRIDKFKTRRQAAHVAQEKLQAKASKALKQNSDLKSNKLLAQIEKKPKISKKNPKDEKTLNKSEAKPSPSNEAEADKQKEVKENQPQAETLNEKA